MSLGMSESVRPDTLSILTFFRVTPSRLSSFWVRVIILTLESVTLDTEEREEEREESLDWNSSRSLSLKEEMREDTSVRREERREETSAGTNTSLISLVSVIL